MTVDELKAALKVSNDNLAALTPVVDKIGTETTASLTMIADLKQQIVALNQQIADLINKGIPIPQDLVDLAGSIQDNATSLQGKLKTVDDLVPDSP